MVRSRLVPWLRGRVKTSEVIREGDLDAMTQLEEWNQNPSVPFHVWLRFLVEKRVQELTTPGQVAIRAEHKFLFLMGVLDREILVIPYCEQMTNGDTALALGLEKSAACQCCTRKLPRRKDIWVTLPGSISEELS